MDSKLKSYLEKYSIIYDTHEHPAVFTVEESKSIKLKILGLHTKCLFLKGDNSTFYLVALPALKRLDTKSLRQHLKLKKLSFASSEELKEHLNLTPGSVSIFGIMHSKLVYLILDKEIWDAPLTGFHPNINTSTITLTHKNLEKFYNSIKTKKEIISL